MSEETSNESTPVVETTEQTPEPSPEVKESPLSMSEMLSGGRQDSQETGGEDVTDAEEQTTEEVGERPEWLLEKFNTPEDMAEAYKNLESRFGNLTGAPEEYEVSIPEEIAENVKWFEDAESGMAAFKNIAKEMGIDQTGFNKLTEMYISSEVERANNLQNLRLQAASEAFGGHDKTVEKFTQLNARTKALIGDEATSLLESALTGDVNSNVSVIKLVEGLVNKAQGKEFVQPTHTPAVAKITRDDLNSMVADPRYKTDAAYRAKVSKAFQDFNK